MQLNITTDYAIRTVLFLAMQDKLTTSAEISQAMDIPKNYQLRIIRPLVKNGILQCVQGVKGGFYLRKKSTDITLYDIVSAMEPTMCINKCLEDDRYCNLFTATTCPIQSFYKKMQQAMEGQLKTATIANLLKRP
jgi:Rrf2 family nitric oxide-sensitive transcriptional repressor